MNDVANKKVKQWRRKYGDYDTSHGKHRYVLDLSNHPFTEVPDLPSTVTRLWLNNTNIKTIPHIPKYLYELNISNTNVSELPDLSETMLHTLNIKNSGIKSLSAPLPESLQVLHCDCEILCELPPNLRRLYYSGNAPLPVLPDKVNILVISDSSITKLPEPLPLWLIKLHLKSTKINKIPTELPCLLVEFICKNTPLPDAEINRVNDIIKQKINKY